MHFYKILFSTPDDASARKCERIFGKTSLLFRIQCAIIEAEMRKHEAFIDIFALHSNIVARVIIKAKELFGRLEKADL